MLRILGRTNSLNVQKVVWCACELGLSFERTDIGGAFGGTDTPAFRTMNPNGLVPVIDAWYALLCARRASQDVLTLPVT